MNARNDHKLRTFMSSFGRNWRDGYFYFFTLLELCGNDARDGKTDHTFHINTLRELWGTSTKGVQEVCKLCTESALVMCNIRTSHVTFSLPNLLNYTGQYDRKPSNKPNEIKSNESKVNTPPASPDLKVVKTKKAKKNLPSVSPSDFRNPKDSPELFALEAPSLDEEVSLSDLARNAITAINTICGKTFRPTSGHMRHIHARINEGYKFEDFVKVIKFKQDQWGNDPKMRAFLRPETIFGTKFDSYLAESSDNRLVDLEHERMIADLFPGCSA